MTHAPSTRPDVRNETAVVAVVRFLRMLRFRRQYVIGAVVVSGVLGCLYFLTAQRVYESRTQLLVTQSGPEESNTTLSSDGSGALLPTCERLVKSAVVLASAVRQIANLPPELRPDFVKVPQHKWEETLRQNLSATAIRRTNVIEIWYRSKTPAGAKAVVDAVVQSYIQFMDENHKNVSVEIVTVLDKESKEIEQKLIEKQRQLLEVQHRVGDLGLRENSNAVHPILQRVLNLNDTLVEVKKKRVQLEASLSALRLALSRGGDLRNHLIGVEPLVGRQMMMSALGLTPEAGESASQVERMLIENRSKLETLLNYYGPRHPEVVELTRSISNAEQYLAQDLANRNQRLQQMQGGQLGPMMVAMVEQQLTESIAHEQQLATELAASQQAAVGLNNRMMELQIVEGEMERLRAFHTSLQNKITTLDVNDQQADVRITIVSEPTLSDRPVEPKLAMIVFLCLFGGFGCGTVIVYVVDMLEDRFKSPDELKDQLGLPVLAMIRQLPETESSGVNALAVHVAPQSPESESFRTLRTTLALSGDEFERIAITSTGSGDGKTTVMANLAAACAQAGKKTLVIDADMRRPGLTKLLDLRGVGGLSEVLRQDEDIAELCRERIQETDVPGLHILPCGPRPQNPSELLSGSRMADLVAWAENAYDQVLIDCPPVLAASDAALVGRIVDGVLFVVQPQRNHRRVVIRASETLRSLKINVMGIVANLMGDHEESGYYGYDEDFGYAYRYESRYEDDDDLEETVDDDDSVAPRRAA